MWHTVCGVQDYYSTVCLYEQMYTVVALPQDSGVLQHIHNTGTNTTCGSSALVQNTMSLLAAPDPAGSPSGLAHHQRPNSSTLIVSFDGLHLNSLP